MTPGAADPQTVREVEHKLRVHGLFELPDLTAAGCGVARVEPQPTLRLTAAYFDTADLRLARHKVTLRRRDGGEDDGWHLKLPADDAAAKPRAARPAGTSCSCPWTPPPRTARRRASCSTWCSG